MQSLAVPNQVVTLKWLLEASWSSPFAKFVMSYPLLRRFDLLVTSLGCQGRRQNQHNCTIAFLICTLIPCPACDFQANVAWLCKVALAWSRWGTPSLSQHCPTAAMSVESATHLRMNECHDVVQGKIS